MAGGRRILACGHRGAGLFGQVDARAVVTQSSLRLLVGGRSPRTPYEHGAAMARGCCRRVRHGAPTVLFSSGPSVGGRLRKSVSDERAAVHGGAVQIVVKVFAEVGVEQSRDGSEERLQERRSLFENSVEAIDVHKEAQELKTSFTHARSVRIDVNPQPTFEDFSSRLLSARQCNVRGLHLTGYGTLAAASTG